MESNAATRRPPKMSSKLANAKLTSSREAAAAGDWAWSVALSNRTGMKRCDGGGPLAPDSLSFLLEGSTSWLIRPQGDRWIDATARLRRDCACHSRGNGDRRHDDAE